MRDIVCLELQLHRLEGGGGLDGPDPAILGDLAGWPENCKYFDKTEQFTWCRGSGGLPQEKVDVKLLQHLLVLLGGGPLVLTLERVHHQVEIWSAMLNKWGNLSNCANVKLKQFIHWNLIMIRLQQQPRGHWHTNCRDCSNGSYCSH